MRKPRILMCTEASFLKTGYAVYSLEVQKRLHATGKYELAELGCCAHTTDPRRARMPWKFYGNLPDNDPKQINEYTKHSPNQFGEFRFNEVVNEFRPDIVWDIRDHWMCEFAERSPHRRHYSWALMPTVDSVPQHEQWLSTYINADIINTYSDWGLDVLKREGGGLINTHKPAPPCADFDSYKPLDRAALRRRFAIYDDAFIIGTVMRNQPRKLYPELIEGFAEYLRVVSPKTAKRSFLYLHTTYPDNGWDIPKLIKEHGVSHKTIVTYICRDCHQIFPSFFQDSRAFCSCGSRNAFMPTTNHGIDASRLAEIMNIFDVYVQYANCEGFGMPQVEAAACGVPIMSVDYSAMSDVVRKVQGTPLSVLTYKIDFDLGCKRAIPDNRSLVSSLAWFFEYLSEEERLARRERTQNAAREHYSWDQTAAVWEETFDSLPLSDSWESPARLHTPPAQIPSFITSEDFVKWAIVNVLGRPEMLSSYMAVRLIRDLNWGMAVSTVAGNYLNEDSLAGQNSTPSEFTPDDAIKELLKLCETNNKWEKIRCGLDSKS